MSAYSLFDKMHVDDLCRDPFPHIVVEDALPCELASELLETIPDFNSAKDKMRCTAYQFEANGEPKKGSKYILDPLTKENRARMSTWMNFLEGLLKVEETKKLWSCFEEEIASLYPAIYEQLKDNSIWRAGKRGIASVEENDFLLDAEIVYHEPANERTQERGPHLKVRNKILECHLMLRDENNDTAGGDLELYRFNKGCFILYEPQQQIKNRAVLEHVKTIPYKHNQCVAWLNSASTVMAYSPREASPYPLQYMATVVQLPKPIFALPSHSGTPSK